LTKTAPKGGNSLQKTGRPVSIKPDAKTLATVVGLGKIQATTRECAAVLCVSHQTFIATMKRHPEIAEALDRGKEQGRTSLRRTQFRLAEKNAAMAIFLGKNYLDQTDKQDINASVQADVKVSDARSRLEYLLTRVSGAGSQGGNPQ
jgi:hypothetical protein